MYKITLANGTIIDNIELDGSAFSSKTSIDSNIFKHNLSPVDIEYIGNPEDEPIISVPIGHFENMEFFRITGIDSNDFTFVLKPIPESEMQLLNLRSQVEYLAMMTGIDLE